MAILATGPVLGDANPAAGVFVAFAITVPGELHPHSAKFVAEDFFALGANDMLRGIDPDVSRENLSKILTVARAQEVEVLLVGLKAPANLGAGYKSDFDAIFPELEEGVAKMPAARVGLKGRDGRALKMTT